MSAARMKGNNTRLDGKKDRGYSAYQSVQYQEVPKLTVYNKNRLLGKTSDQL